MPILQFKMEIIFHLSMIRYGKTADKMGEDMWQKVAWS
jgi:hypothetical protein